ncbi:MAG: hypothetical protein ACD_23C00010G0001, partial [uncultured bacterium]
MFRCGPATKGSLPSRQCTAPMSLASTMNRPLAVILCNTVTSAPDSISTWVDSTTSLPASRSTAAMS